MGGEQTAEHGAGAHGGQEGAVEPGPAMEGDLGQEREGDGEVEGEHADDGHGEERGAQVGRGPDVTEPLTNLALGPCRRPAWSRDRLGA